MLVSFFNGLGYLWRDKWTVISRLLIPLVITLVIISSTLGFISANLEQNMRGIPLVAVSGMEEAPELMEALRKRKDIRLNETIGEKDVKKAGKIDTLDLGIVFSEGFEENIKSGQSGQAGFYYDSGSGFVALSRVEDAFNDYQNTILNARLDSVQLSRTFIQPLNIIKTDANNPVSFATKNIAGFTTLMVLMFGFLACIYPSLDLATSIYDKNFSGFLGTLASIAVFGLFFAFFTYLGLRISLSANPSMSPLIINAFKATITWPKLVKTLMMLVPCMFFFAALLTWTGLSAKTFKNAQNTIQPLKLAMLFLLIWAMMPFLELNVRNAWVPILNTAVGVRDLLQTNTFTLPMYLSSGFLIVYAGLALWMCRRYVGK